METRSLERPGGAIVYDVYRGSGAPLVCVPGIGDTRESWRAFAPAMAAAGHAVYVIDLRGHGGSDASFGSYTTADIGDDIVSLLEAEGLSGAVIVGNSIGGGAACWAAACAPERIARLVLINPFVRDMPAERWMRPMVPVLFAQPWGVWAWGQYRKGLFRTPPPDLAANHAAVLANLREPGRLTAVRAMLRASKADVAARLSELSVPSLALMGAADPDYPDPAAEAEALRALLGGPVSIAVVDRTGHYPQIERPDETVAQVRAFLEQEAASGA